jgi:Na+-driven multidrug efflux pump
MQTITGNNFGAEKWHRSDQSLRIALGISTLYCGLVQVIVTVVPRPIAAAFVDDIAVINEVARVLPMTTLAFVLVGPLMMISTYFQAIGDATKAAVLGLIKPYLFAIPLTFMLPIWVGERGIWYAGPVAEVMLLILTVAVLWIRAQATGLKWGIFQTTKGGAQ